MKNDKIIRKNPLFELYVENRHLVIRNEDYIKDNCVVDLNSISHLELIRSLSFFDKIIEFTFGFWQQSKSDVLRIHLKNGFKDIILTNCDIKKTELLIYEINLLILELENNTKPI
ncbi:hypothetical protein [Flavobacterium sp.]|uniref:hypothetical protein n=1 Tax=Flavobacterium sp. TaxID=239 RepID=UPI000EC71FA3|nr:hypothetical protein [Flavobacterium sp.]HCQ14037.1 hypothetical protein [Flavobacterium sp.]